MAFPLSRMGRVSEFGQLFIRTDPATPPGVSLNALRVSQLGVLRGDLVNDPDYHVNGFPMKAQAICFHVGGPIHHYLQGLPRTITGRIVAQTNSIIGNSDTFADKVRVGPFGGVYLIDITPVEQTAWSTGFSNGFGL